MLIVLNSLIAMKRPWSGRVRAEGRIQGSVVLMGGIFVFFYHQFDYLNKVKWIGAQGADTLEKNHLFLLFVLLQDQEYIC